MFVRITMAFIFPNVLNMVCPVRFQSPLIFSLTLYHCWQLVSANRRFYPKYAQLCFNCLFAVDALAYLRPDWRILIFKITHYQQVFSYVVAECDRFLV